MLDRKSFLPQNKDRKRATTGGAVSAPVKDVSRHIRHARDCITLFHPYQLFCEGVCFLCLIIPNLSAASLSPKFWPAFRKRRSVKSLRHWTRRFRAMKFPENRSKSFQRAGSAGP